MTDLTTIVQSARGAVERGERFVAENFYSMILRDTEVLSSSTHRLARGEACMFFARAAVFKGKLGTAADWYFEAVQADPLCADYRVEMIRKALIPMHMLKDARIEAERATKLAPDDRETWRILGQVEHALGNAKRACAAYERQLGIAPADPISLLDYASIALDMADYELASLCCVRMPQRSKYDGDRLHVLGMIAYRQNRHHEAIDLFRQAIEAPCQDPELARWNMSLAMHSIGYYRQGWAASEARGRQKTDSSMSRVMNRFRLPMWAGEPAPATLHVHQEMGHGDTIAMARYLPLLVEQGYNVHLEVADGSVDLMRDSLPGVLVMPKSIDYPGAIGIPPFDYHVPMLSLPFLFGTDIDTVPWRGPYLKADPKKVAIVSQQLPAGAIGLCWSSGIREGALWLEEYGRRKSMPFKTMKPILHGAPSDTMFVSLQAGPERSQNTMEDFVKDILPENPTWADTAAVIECLDLVITVDTAVAHLAGAMGKPVWVLVADHAASWHWLRDRQDSPWYPSAKLYRQSPEKAPDWHAVIKAVAADMVNWRQEKAA